MGNDSPRLPGPKPGCIWAKVIGGGVQACSLSTLLCDTGSPCRQTRLALKSQRHLPLGLEALPWTFRFSDCLLHTLDYDDKLKLQTVASVGIDWRLVGACLSLCPNPILNCNVASQQENRCLWANEARTECA